ncbi:MAG: hypothetical protein JKY53_12420 [Flavobacteriales bacterium]|nr:hypothetical protein [Flavobacteriales bacterium]
MKKYFQFILIAIFILSLFQCGSSEKKEESVSETLVEGNTNSIDSLGVISCHLKNSDYVVKMKISGVEKKVWEEAFSFQEDEYSVPVKKNGYDLKIKFKVNNPYDKELMIPIPHNFSLTFEDYEFMDDQYYSKSCSCNAWGSRGVTNNEGVDLYKLTDGQCGDGLRCIKFEPQETKEFIVRFTQIIHESQKQVILIGFGLEWKNPKWTFPADVGMKIDVEKNTFLGLKKF